MDRQQREALHERASQHYVKGEFGDSLRVWQELLRHDPGDDRALEGVRLSRLLSPEAGEVEQDEAQTAVASAAPAEELAFDLDLSMLEAAAAVKKGQRPTATTPAATRHEVRPIGVSAVPDEPPPLLVAPADAGPSSDPVVPGEPADEALFDVPDLDDIPLAAPESTPAARPAGELAGRVRQLLDDARAAVAADRREDALAIVARVLVLDEENEEARALEESLQDDARRTAQQIDDWIVEGVQAFERKDTALARQRFDQVLEVMPEHAEALEYRARLDESAAPTSETAPPSIFDDLAVPAAAPAPPGPSLFEAEVGSAAPLLARPAEPPRPAPRPQPVLEALAPTAVRRTGWLAAPLLLAALLLVGGGAAAVVWLAPWDRGGDDRADADAPAKGSTRQIPDGSDGAPAAIASTAGPAAAPTRADLLADLPDTLARAERAMQSADYSGAVLAYGEALELDPHNAVARAALVEAGRKYREQKARAEQLERAKAAFADGEYASALRIFYRLPDEVGADALDRYKVAGWYNLGVVALKAGELQEAASHLDEALAIDPDDDRSKRLRAFARRYAESIKDRAYYATVEALEFRPAESSDQ